MLIGNLPRGYDPSKNDVIVFSKDGVHLLKIPYQDFLKGTGSGKGLKFWIEDEHSIKRLITLDNDYSSNDHFLVPGNAELTVALDIEWVDIDYPIYDGNVLTRKYFGEGYLFNGCYFFRRTSSKDCIGGALRYKYWDGGDSRLPDTDVADIGNVESHRRHDISLPGWLLMSTDPNAVKYELVYRNSSGIETVLDTVDPLEDTITIAELEFYVSGYVDPTIYEPIFIESTGGQYKETKFINSQYWPSSEGNFSVFATESGLPNYIYYINNYLGPNRKQWVLEQTSYDTALNHDIFVPYFTPDEHFIHNSDVYLYNYKIDSELYTLKQPWDDEEDPPVTNYLFYHYNDITYVGGEPSLITTYETPNWKNDGKQSHAKGETGSYNLKLNCFDPEKEFAWLGFVVDYTGYSYDSETAAKDATHYIIHDAGINDLNCFFTGIVDDPKNKVAFYTGKGKGIVDGDIPPETSMSGIIFSDGTFAGSKYMLLDSEGLKKDLVTPVLFEGTKIADVNGVSLFAPSGGGGGGGGEGTPYTLTKLYEAPNATQTTPITFTQKADYDEWDELLVYFMNKDANANFRYIVPLVFTNVDWFYDYSPLAFNFALPGLTTARYAGVKMFIRSEWGKGNYAGSTLPQYQQRRIIGLSVGAWSGSEAYIKAVYAIKYGNGSGGGGGGGGSSYNILVGTTTPFDGTGNDGDLYFVKDSGYKYKYLKFEITEQKTTNTYTQLSEIKFVDTNGNVADLHGLHCKANKPLYTYTQTNEMMFDGFTQTKGLWVASPTVNDPIIIECTLQEPLDISVYNTLQLWTANDAATRDPSGWKLSVSNDKEYWTVVNQVDHYIMTDTRQALGYTNTLTLPQASQTFIKQKYYKESGHWIPILD